jgi:hypothetical protein
VKIDAILDCGVIANLNRRESVPARTQATIGIEGD